MCESHSIPGGAAHAWVRDGYHFESGPSLYSGMADVGKQANPLAHVLQAIGEPLDLIKYDTWNVLVPEGTFLTRVGAEQFCEVLQQVRGPAAVAEWRALQQHMRPLSRASALLPPAAIRFDAGVALTAAARCAANPRVCGRIAVRPPPAPTCLQWHSAGARARCIIVWARTCIPGAALLLLLPLQCCSCPDASPLPRWSQPLLFPLVCPPGAVTSSLQSSNSTFHLLLGYSTVYLIATCPPAATGTCHRC